MAKILLVEDDNNLREIYEARLQAEGYVIVSASDGEQALVVAKNERPDLVISDVMMPKISGFEMLDILRNTEGLKDVKVIMLTALGQSEDKTRADQLGANKYLVKSQVTLEDIVKTAHQLLDDAPAPAPTASPDTVAAATAAPEPVSTAPTPPPATTPTPLAPTPTTSTTPIDAATPVASPVAPEPVSTPTPSPSPAPAPTTPAPEPLDPPQPTTPAPPLPDADAVDPRKDDDPANDPLSTAEETAAMQAKINDFEAKPAEAPAAVDPETADDQANDAVMASAVNELSSAVPEASQKPSEVTAVEVSPAPDTATTPTTTPSPAPASETVTPAPADDGLTINGKKVIKPLGETTEKKDINELYAEEMAKAEPAPTPPPAPSAAPTPATPPPTNPGTPTDPSDPNTVAL